MLRKSTHNVHLDILLPEVLLVLSAEEPESKDRERQVDHMVELGAHLPSGYLPWVSLRLEVVGSSMEPVSVPVHLEIVKVFELVERMVLQVVIH